MNLRHHFLHLIKPKDGKYDKRFQIACVTVQAFERLQIVKPENLNLPKIDVLCDVNNSFCGEKGAAKIFGLQKGVTAEMVEQFECGLSSLADIIDKQPGKKSMMSC